MSFEILYENNLPKLLDIRLNQTPLYLYNTRFNNILKVKMTSFYVGNIVKN